MRSKSWRFKNLLTTSAPNVNDTPLSFSPQPFVSLSGSDHSKSQRRPERKLKCSLVLVTYHSKEPAQKFTAHTDHESWRLLCVLMPHYLFTQASVNCALLQCILFMTSSIKLLFNFGQNAREIIHQHHSSPFDYPCT